MEQDRPPLRYLPCLSFVPSWALFTKKLQRNAITYTESIGHCTTLRCLIVEFQHLVSGISVSSTTLGHVNTAHFQLEIHLAGWLVGLDINFIYHGRNM